MSHGLIPGLFGRSEVQNGGLLVRTWRRVASAGADHFYIDDGSGVNVKCLVPAGATLPGQGTCVGVTGVTSYENVGQELHRLLRIRTQEDFVVL